jgi:predicted acetyltransferase
MRKYRRQGVGTYAARHIFASYPGKWTVRQRITNPAASAFWRKTTPHRFDEAEINGEFVQSFWADGSN